MQPVVEKWLHRLIQRVVSNSATHRYYRPPVSNYHQHHKILGNFRFTERIAGLCFGVAATLYFALKKLKKKYV